MSGLVTSSPSIQPLFHFLNEIFMIQISPYKIVTLKAFSFVHFLQQQFKYIIKNTKLHGNYRILEFANIFFLFTSAVVCAATTMILDELCILLLPCKRTAGFIRCTRHAYNLPACSMKYGPATLQIRYRKKGIKYGGSVRSWLGSTDVCYLLMGTLLQSTVTIILSNVCNLRTVRIVLLQSVCRIVM